MIRMRALGALLGVGLFAASLPGCLEVLIPCYKEKRSYFNEEGDATRGPMNGLYRLTSIDGAPIPISGYALPPFGSEVLHSAALVFKTQTLEFDDKCEEIVRSTGVVVAVYLVGPANGDASNKTYTGTFERVHTGKGLTLAAAGRSVPATSDNVSIDLTATVPVLSTEISYKLHFEHRFTD